MGQEISSTAFVLSWKQPESLPVGSRQSDSFIDKTCHIQFAMKLKLVSVCVTTDLTDLIILILYIIDLIILILNAIDLIILILYVSDLFILFL